MFFGGSETAIFVPRGKRSDWILFNVFFIVNLSQMEVLRGADAWTTYFSF